ncbi:hypothetical protein HY411_01475 [Candidatus Gottesmanbacteria bacterium]|nr:hypothetical protein [Candidatus Gottesmanbacteria bacterium]
MPTIQELGISDIELSRHPKGGGAVRDTALGPDGQLHGSTYCDGGDWRVVSVSPRSGDQSTKEVIVACGLCDAHLHVDVARHTNNLHQSPPSVPM